MHKRWITDHEVDSSLNDLFHLLARNSFAPLRSCSISPPQLAFAFSMPSFPACSEQQKYLPTQQQ